MRQPSECSKTKPPREIKSCTFVRVAFVLQFGSDCECTALSVCLNNCLVAP